MKHLVSLLLAVAVPWVAGRAAPDTLGRRPAESYGQAPTIGYDYSPPIYTPPVNTYASPPVNTYASPPVETYGNVHGVRPCREGEVLRVDGVCDHPEVTKTVFVFEAPQRPRTYRPPPPIPKPRIHNELIFIRPPEQELPAAPVVVPAPQKKSTIFLLSKKQEHEQQVIQLPPEPHHTPNVYFVHYEDGENPILPDGTDLHSALGQVGLNINQLEQGGDYGGDVVVHGGGGGSGYGVPDITVAGDVGVVGGGYGGNDAHEVIIETGYGGNPDPHHY
ncbi:extensin-3-like [Portunus trituberculatus]|uniref:extensin-3-like n=1 Tax=Portunus trituberculatus TaxID=210409 RepID=UPI001E1CBF8D|nr:extensin-3-like [Portunus trituberculatus]